MKEANGIIGRTSMLNDDGMAFRNLHDTEGSNLTSCGLTRLTKMIAERESDQFGRSMKNVIPP